MGAGRKRAVVRDAGDGVVAEDIQLRDGGERGRVPVDVADGHLDGRVRVVEAEARSPPRGLDDDCRAHLCAAREPLGHRAGGEGAGEEWEEGEECGAHV